eukprot:gene9845-biopygen19761
MSQKKHIPRMWGGAEASNDQSEQKAVIFRTDASLIIDRVHMHHAASAAPAPHGQERRTAGQPGCPAAGCGSAQGGRLAMPLGAARRAAPH